MTIAPTLIQPRLKRSEKRIVDKLDQFSIHYGKLIAEDKKQYLSEFSDLCKKAEKKPAVFKKIAEVYLKLQPIDQQSMLTHSFPFMERHVIERLNIPESPCFYPLLLLADDCSLNPESKQMIPLYNQLLTVLRTQGLLLNQLIERRYLSRQAFKPDLPLKALMVERGGMPIRQKVCSLSEPPFYFAATTTHQRLQAPDQSIDTDPFADDGVAFEARQEDRTLRMVSITDGGGRGNSVVETAELVNRLFLTSLVSTTHNVQSAEQAEQLLLQAVFQTQQELREFPHIQHATHAGLLSVYTDRNEQFGAVSRHGDTTAYLLIESSNAITVKKLFFQDCSKRVSHNGGGFSKTGDYSSLSTATFKLPRAQRACIILGTDGLADNLDPRNSLRSDLYALIETEPEKYYQKHTLTLSSRTLSISNALMDARDQKDLQIYAATHLYPTPWSLHADLSESALTPDESIYLESIAIDAAHTWNDPAPETIHQINQLIDLYSSVKIRTLYQESTPETFAQTLASYARKQGKSDDILASVCWITM